MQLELLEIGEKSEYKPKKKKKKRKEKNQFDS